jgi:hypothetical protein
MKMKNEVSLLWSQKDIWYVNQFWTHTVMLRKQPAWTFIKNDFVLDGPKIVIVFITPHFMNEYHFMIQPIKESGVRIIGIRCEDTDIEGTGLETLVLLPRSERPLSESPNTDKEFVRIVQELKTVMKSVQ